MGDKQFGIDNNRLMQYANDIKEISQMDVEIGIVIGGGNIFRGVQADKGGMDRTQGDYMATPSVEGGGTLGGLATITAVGIT